MFHVELTTSRSTTTVMPGGGGNAFTVIGYVRRYFSREETSRIISLWHLDNRAGYLTLDRISLSKELPIYVD